MPRPSFRRAAQDRSRNATPTRNLPALLHQSQFMILFVVSPTMHSPPCPLVLCFRPANSLPSHLLELYELGQTRAERILDGALDLLHLLERGPSRESLLLAYQKLADAKLPPSSGPASRRGAHTHAPHSTGSSRARTGPAGCRYSPILYNKTPQYVQGARCPCRSLSPATCSTPHPNSPSSSSAPYHTGRTARWRTVGMQQRRCQDDSKRRTNLLTGTLFPPSGLVNAGHHCAGSLPAQVGRQRLGHHRRRRVRRYRVSGMFA